MIQVSVGGDRTGPATATCRQVTLLFIEDSDTEASRFVALLEQAAPARFDMARVTTIAEATSYLQVNVTDCAVVDLGPADVEHCRSIIEALAARSPLLVLIVLTDLDDDDFGVAMLEAGADFYLHKGTTEGKLLVRCIRHAIAHKRVESAFAEAQGLARVGSWEMDIATSAFRWSRELCRLFDFDVDAEPVYGALLTRIHPNDQDAIRRAFATMMREFTPLLAEYRVVLNDGQIRWVRGRGQVEFDASGRVERMVGTVQDITEQKLARDTLLHHVFHDPLTGLPNRLLLLDRLTQALSRLLRNPSTVAVIYLDIDRFRVINDSLGHDAGDQLLIAVAARLAALVRPQDTLARTGGDEFVVLCEGLADQAEAIGIADRICEAMREPLAWEGGDLVISLRAGIAISRSGSVSPETLLRDADAAMFCAKGEARARCVVFAETMRAKAVGRLDTEMSLRRSIADGDLRLHYQPIVTLEGGHVLGHEALVRWAHPTRGLIAPDQFITIAEESGLIVPLGAWVLREACLQAKRFQARAPMWSQLTMSVNLSGRQLGQPDLAEVVSSALHDAGLEPEHLQLEMTESVLMDDAATTITILETLKSLGLRLGVDDFGTGYSSLAYLRRFPVDVLKIDRSFVDGLGRDLEDSAIVAALVSLADTLGLTTIAEGVETELQRESLLVLGCSLAQGYFFGRPVAAEDAEMVLDRAAGAVNVGF
jgi:diguanylate cyclase (GGDEF)-like protein/PAS domain S-box-containing protein